MSTSAELKKQPPRAGLLFQRLRWWIARNSWRNMIGHSIVKPLTILLSSLLVVAFVFVVSFAGFRFLVEVIQLPPHGQILELLIGLLFFSLALLLVFSGGLILHGSLFSAAETAFLLSKPVPADQVFAYKFQGAVGFSSWAFLLLGGPILIAYGIVTGCPWYYYLLLPPYFFGFVLMPGSLGAIGVLLLVNYFPKRRIQVLVLAIIAVVLVTGWWTYSVIAENRASMRSNESANEAANQFLLRISFGRSIFLPSGWVARGLMATGRGELTTNAYYLGLVWSNGLFFYLCAAWMSSFLYRRGFNRLATGGDLRRKHGGLWMDRILERLLWFINSRTRLLIIKDFRTFRRDPQQWGQVVLFTSLLLLYYTNIKRMFIKDIEWPFQNSISFLNHSAIALLLSAYTGRFIYPLLSLEGRKFWILGLLPLEREQLLWGKFAFSTAGGMVLSLIMSLISDIMLDMPPTIIVIHLACVVVLAAGLSGLSVGIGACLPNFRETDPSKIAVGFGGTINLIVGLGFLLLVLTLMVAPWHLFMIHHKPEDTMPIYFFPAIGIGMTAGLAVGVFAVFLPLRAGIIALKQMEF